MANTARTVAELNTLLADNTVKSISAQTARDVLLSLTPVHGEIYVSTPAATVITDTTSFFPLNGTYTTALLDEWTMDVSGQLKYTGAPDRFCHVAMSISVTAASNNQTLVFGIAKNGSVIAGSEQSRKVATGSDVGSTALHTAARVSTNDYLSVVVKNTTSTANITAEYLNIFALGMIVKT